MIDHKTRKRYHLIHFILNSNLLQKKIGDIISQVIMSFLTLSNILEKCL